MFYVLGPFFFAFGLGCLLGLAYGAYLAITILIPLGYRCTRDVLRCWRTAIREVRQEGGSENLISPPEDLGKGIDYREL